MLDKMRGAEVWLPGLGGQVDLYADAAIGAKAAEFGGGPIRLL